MNHKITTTHPVRQVQVREVDASRHGLNQRYIYLGDGIGWVEPVSVPLGIELKDLLAQFDNPPPEPVTRSGGDDLAPPLVPTQEERLTALEMSIQGLIQNIAKLGERLDTRAAYAQQRLGPQFGAGALSGLFSPPSPPSLSPGQVLSKILDEILGDEEDEVEPTRCGCGHPEREMLNAIFGGAGPKVQPTGALGRILSDHRLPRPKQPDSFNAQQREAMKLIQALAESVGLKVKLPE